MKRGNVRCGIVRKVLGDLDELLMDKLVVMRRRVETWVRAGYPRAQLLEQIDAATQAARLVKGTPPVPAR